MIRKAMNTLLNWIKPVRESASVVIVRRYGTANGYIGELYINGRNIGVTCDNLAVTGVRSKPLTRTWPFKALTNGIDTIRYGDFAVRAPLGVAFVGSTTQSETKQVINNLLDAVNGKEVSLTILERLWADLKA